MGCGASTKSCDKDTNAKKEESGAAASPKDADAANASAADASAGAKPAAAPAAPAAAEAAAAPEAAPTPSKKLKAALGGGGKRRPIVGGNWKCNPESMETLDGLMETMNKCDTSKCDVYVCPSLLHTRACCEKAKGDVKICPQNCNIKGCGAFTGEMAVEQMKDLGIEWVLIGHSERREYFKESDEMLATKLKYILDAGMKCVFCIGEKLPEREKGLEATMAVCITQMEKIKGMMDPAKVVIAYEPVWAIGTGVTASPEQAQETHAAIRKWIGENVSAECAAGIRIQYGGSASAKNAPELSACPDIDGFLVGGAALKPEFIDIVAAIGSAKA